MIEVHNLVKRYGAHLAVDRLSFTVEQGQVYGFLGPNGAGKSTTLNMMTGYLGPTSGEVLVAGHSITAEPDEARRHIGYLPEQPPLYTDMTVDEYLLFAAGLKKLPRAQRGEQVDQVKELTMLSDVGGRLIRNLSKGYRQRVGLAQALLGFPEIIILDEPTVGLDPKQIIEIRTLIRDLAREHTVILSSHILSEIQAVCDHVLIIHHGKKVAEGAIRDLERSLAGPVCLDVVVKGDAQAARSALAGLPGVSGVTPIPTPGDGEAGLRLEQKEGADLRQAVFQACVQAGLPLLELRPDAVTLEDVFLKLTADDAPEGRDTEGPALDSGDGGEAGAGQEQAPDPQQPAGDEPTPAEYGKEEESQ